MSEVNRFKAVRLTKGAKFMGLDIEIQKLSVTQVLEVQDRAAAVTEDANDNIRLLNFVIQSGAPELKEMSEDDMKEFPMDELTQLSDAIMIFSGLMTKKKDGVK